VSPPRPRAVRPPLTTTCPSDVPGATTRRDDAPADGAGVPAVTVTLCPDGPLLVRGDVEIRTPDGTVVPGRRATTALCRCGLSGRKPFCDGSHKVSGFRTGVEG
jgi:CDGSH-type Zn-finger protein